MNDKDVVAVVVRLGPRPASGADGEGRAGAEPPKQLNEMSHEELSGLLARYLKSVLPDPWCSKKECNPFAATLCRAVRRHKAGQAIEAFARTYAHILRGD